MFDALYDTLDRLDRIEGHKYVILVSTGFDSFSKLNLDQIMKKVKTTHDVTIFPISIGWMLREYCETHVARGYSHGMGIPVSEMDYLQADNEMQTFARMTGGRFYQPRFRGGIPGGLSRHRRRHSQPVQPRISSNQPANSMEPTASSK